MRFAISLLNLRPGRIGGTETYLRELVRHLPDVLEGDEAFVVLDRDVAGSVETPGLGRVVVDVDPGRLIAWRCLEAFTPWRCRRVEAAIAAMAPDAALFPQQSIFPKALATPAVLTVVDVQHLVLPGNFATFDRAFRAAIYPYSLDRARRVIAISEYTRETTVEHCGISGGKVVTVPLGIELDATAAVPTDKVAPPYLYYPAVTNPHKNHALLLRTFAALAGSGRLPHRLVLSGQKTPLWKRLQRDIERLGIADRVLHLGYLTREEVRSVYAGADAVVFPSGFEGFGLPVVEAVSLGRKVLCSRLPVFAELGVPEAMRIDFADPDALAAALALPGPTRLEREPWTWHDTARATLEVLRTAARG